MMACKDTQEIALGIATEGVKPSADDRIAIDRADRAIKLNA
jgi:hypothetical protein